MTERQGNRDIGKDEENVIPRISEAEQRQQEFRALIKAQLPSEGKHGEITRLELEQALYELTGIEL